MISKDSLLFKKSNTFKILLWITAIVVASSSAYYSVFGLSQLFAGASLSVALMAASLEVAKLVSATFLHRYWQHVSKILKIYLTIGVIVLMAITSAGVYGFLSKAYEHTANKLKYVEQQVSVLEAKKDIFIKKRESLQKDLSLREQRVSSLNDIRKSQESNYSKSLGTRSTRRLQSSIDATEKTTQSTYAYIDKINQELSAVSDSISSYESRIVDAKNSDATQELGPLMYISRLTGFDMDTVINWFILLIVFVFDPLAVSLVLAANFLSKQQMDTEFEEQSGEDVSNNNEKRFNENELLNDNPIHILSDTEISDVVDSEEVSNFTDDFVVDTQSYTSDDFTQSDDDVQEDVQPDTVDEFYGDLPNEVIEPESEHHEMKVPVHKDHSYTQHVKI